MKTKFISIQPEGEPPTNLPFVIYADDNIHVATIRWTEGKWLVYNWESRRIPETAEHLNFEEAVSEILALIKKYPRIIRKNINGNLPTLEKVFPNQRR